MVRRKRLAAVTLLIALGAPFSWADVGGKITGTVKDQTNAVIAGATVVAVNTATGMKQMTKTDEQGSYAFPVLPVGQYEIDVTADGFNPNKTRSLAIDINAALTVDVTLQVSDQNQTVIVTEGAARVGNAATQLGEVIHHQQDTTHSLHRRG